MIWGTLASGMSLFLVCFLIHFVWWKLHSVKKEIFTVVLIFIGLPVLHYLGLYIRGRMDIGQAASGLLVLALSCAYIQTYPVLRVRIPTFRILTLIHESGREGMKSDDVMNRLERDEELFPNKILELQNDALVRKSDDRLTLTLAGRCVGVFFRLYRSLLGLEIGKG